MRRAYFFKALAVLPFMPAVLERLKPAQRFVNIPMPHEATYLFEGIVKVRYGLCPGWVTEPVIEAMPEIFRTHYISAPELAQLYGVSLDECLVARTEWTDPEYRKLVPPPTDGPVDIPGIIMLRPRADGDYRLPRRLS